MAVITSLSFESNLGFTFDRQATAADTTLYLKFYNRVTGVATEPIAANRTNLIVVADKGSEGSPNPNYEIIVLGTVGAASGGVSTCTSCVRGITFSTTAITAGSGGKIHQAGSGGGCADVADLWWQVYRVMDGTYGTNANNLRVGAESAADVSFYVQNDQTVKPRLYFDDSEKRFKISWGDDAPAAGDVDGVGVPQLTTTERDALSWPAGGGQVIYNTTEGYTQFREGGTWVENVSGATVANASTTVAGKVEEATTAEMGAGTAAGATGARLFVNSGNLVKTSSGAGDENKVPVLNSAGRVASGFANTVVDVQEFTAAGAGTWTKPTSFTPLFVKVVCVGGGGSGGGGQGLAAGNIRSGGTGGGGGARTEKVFRASELGATEAVNVGAGGASVAGGATAVGANGNSGDTSLFGSASACLIAYGGGGGKGGDGGGAGSGAASGGGGGGGVGAGANGADNANVAGGLPGTYTLTPIGTQGGGGQSSGGGGGAETGGAGGGGTNGQTTIYSGGSSYHGGAGGGGGGCLNAANVATAGAVAGSSLTYATGGASSGGGTVGGGAGAAGTAGNSLKGGTGGAGGGSNASGTGGAGGAGGAVGGGGGGGGGGTTTGGAGGVGGDGRIWVYSF